MQPDLKDETTTASKERLRLWLRFLKASSTIEATLRENLRQEFATTLPRFDVMAALSRFEDGLKMSQLSDVLRVSNGNVTGIVDRLSKDGFLVRVPVPGDRRASLVRLTKRGQEEFQQQAMAHEAWVNDMLRDFSPEAAHDISQRLEQLESSLQKDRG
ncbi:MarR family transcriptional regulator [Planktotalea sp.]|uniref:MarR family winged helix-turn-helix transcriptional regulator n=1 Tax=Planktotalea sp. TaxID=2029877 RepID=UPI0025FAE902|nr:MarR family transcriptional regulator [Planktotalea sp.]